METTLFSIIIRLCARIHSGENIANNIFLLTSYQRTSNHAPNDMGISLLVFNYAICVTTTNVRTQANIIII